MQRQTFKAHDNEQKNDFYNYDGLLLGLQMQLGKYVKLAPNFRIRMPKADGESKRHMAYVSCYFGI